MIISKDDCLKIVMYCEQLENTIQKEKPCFSWKQLDEIKFILDYRSS